MAWSENGRTNGQPPGTHPSGWGRLILILLVCVVVLIILRFLSGAAQAHKSIGTSAGQAQPALAAGSTARP